MKHRGIILIILFFSAIDSFSQPCDMPPATNNCESAPIICDIDILDGYCTSMSSILTFNAPAPMCSNGGSPHNPFWIGFAGCNALELNIHLANCDTVNGTTGVQCAIYGYGGNGLCTSSFDQPGEILDCDVACPNDNLITLNANGMTVGRIYYFVIDGCAGSVCDLTISVNNFCGAPNIDNWIEPIEGPSLSCVGTLSKYIIQPPEGAIDFWWYLVDGQENLQWQNPATEIPPKVYRAFWWIVLYILTRFQHSSMMGLQSFYPIIDIGCSAEIIDRNSQVTNRSCTTINNKVVDCCPDSHPIRIQRD